MEMKALIRTMAVAAMPLLFSLHASGYTTKTATLYVNGSVTAQPCTVSRTQMTVSLGDIYTSTLVGAGAATPWVPFTLSLTACPDGTNGVTAVFSGATDSNGNFSNQGTAGDMAVQLETQSGTLLTSGSSLQTAVDQSQNAAFSLQARAITSGGNPTSGTLQSAINITYTWQ
ncbi:type 1 fimbrial protein [Pantoea dispersa]|uniref:fimbrial protein n=1 Tax=Pantoea dispersa TaxID=59814 RepID=UPI000FD7ED5C|nr:fimbrial protein [Pantoea dispersa]MCT6592549.1 type 1 fimbrial protein [Pantoea dispersa]MCW0323428.1 Protein FimG [Pantoea dispersa]MCW0328164.1 Protein FimG [Pantoea dispersa]MCW0434637.1 Protein FimG [Pantoea dispersa]RVU72247.1 type 1 fimbrial protein [Pantoea dispersa]